MSVVAAAVIGSAVISGVVANKQAKAQKKASQYATNAQVQANRENIEFQRELYEQQREDIAPWRDIGVQALESLNRGIESGQFDPGKFTFNFEEDPGYQFRLAEGQKAMDRSAAARGNLLSGGQAKALTQYNQGMASQEYGNAFARAMQEHSVESGRKGDEFNRLASMAGVGQTASQQMQSAGNVYGQQVGQGNLNIGNAYANNALNQGNIKSNLYGAYGNIANNLISNGLTMYGTGGFGGGGK